MPILSSQFFVRLKPVYKLRQVCSISPMNRLNCFDPGQIETVTTAVGMAEELVSDHFKMSASQWLRQRYDVKTLASLDPSEVVHGPFAQIMRYRGQRRDRSLGSDAYDFYKICLQDHAILAALEAAPEIGLLPFVLYIATHELVHIVRFSRFLQRFDASDEERLAEEALVHALTHDILKTVRLPGLDGVHRYYERWREPFEGLGTS